MAWTIVATLALGQGDGRWPTDGFVAWVDRRTLTSPAKPTLRRADRPEGRLIRGPRLDHRPKLGHDDLVRDSSSLFGVLHPLQDSEDRREFVPNVFQRRIGGQPG